MNCLFDTRVTEQALFTEVRNKRANGESASDMGSRRCRIIPLDKRSNQNTLIQAGDILYSTAHIALCAVGDDEYVTASHVTRDTADYRYFQIIHNYGDDHIHIDTGDYTGGHFCRTLEGPFRHWGVHLGENSSAGRIYLWY